MGLIPSSFMAFETTVKHRNLISRQLIRRLTHLILVQTKQTQYNAYVTLLQALGGSPI